MFASLSVLAWGLQYGGHLPFAPVRGPAWHAHEMVFGFALAIVAGFLFTAVRNWTQQPTPTGGLLAAIVALWAAGRVMAFTPYDLATAAVNAAFALAVAAGIAVPLARSGNRRNYFFVALLGGLAAAAALFYRDLASLRIALDIVLFIVAVIGGRVIPMFTNNGVPGAGASRVAWLEKASLGALLALLAADLAGLEGTALAILALAAATLHGARLWLWHPWRTLRTPLVWSLHAAYAWIVVHLALRALASLGLVAPPLATHALTIGVIGGMTLAMMTRTARGHTGMPLAAGSAEVACYVLVHLAALIRVAGPMAAPPMYVATVVGSAVLWSLAYATYAGRYAPLLTRPRVDGKPG